jgi:hypothetical protein
LRKKNETDPASEAFKKAKSRLIKAINTIYEEANNLSRRKNEEEEALQELNDTQAALIRSVLKGKSIEPLALSEMLADPRKLQRVLSKLGDRKIRREIEQVEKDITRRRSNIEKFELLKKTIEREMCLKLESLFKDLNELNNSYFSRLIKEKEEAYRQVKKQLAELEDTEKNIQEEILECKLALKFEEKPKELFKWW